MSVMSVDVLGMKDDVTLMEYCGNWWCTGVCVSGRVFLKWESGGVSFVNGCGNVLQGLRMGAVVRVV